MFWLLACVQIQACRCISLSLLEVIIIIRRCKSIKSSFRVLFVASECVLLSWIHVWTCLPFVRLYEAMCVSRPAPSHSRKYQYKLLFLSGLPQRMVIVKIITDNMTALLDGLDVFWCFCHLMCWSDILELQPREESLLIVQGSLIHMVSLTVENTRSLTLLGPCCPNVRF